MSELARRRDARDLWVSRSQLHAAVVGAVLVAVLAFAGGYALGRSTVGTAEPARYAALTEAVPGRDLPDLLAQVTRSAMPHPSSAMAYPTWAEAGGSLPVPVEAPASPGVRATVPPPALTEAPQADRLPDAPFTVEVGSFPRHLEAQAVRDHLRALGHDAWMTWRSEGGEATWWVGVGGYETEADADHAAATLGGAVAAAPTTVGTPRGVPLGDARAASGR